MVMCVGFFDVDSDVLDDDDVLFGVVGVCCFVKCVDGDDFMDEDVCDDVIVDFYDLCVIVEVLCVYEDVFEVLCVC